MDVESSSPEETEAVGARIAEKLQPDDVVTISGELGSGKTTLALQFLLEGVRRGEPVLYVVLAETREEIRQVARFLRERVDDPDEPTRNFIVLGDFNIFSESDATMRALTEDGGFSVPEGVTRIPGTNVPRDKKYDQIAFRSAGGFFQATGAAGAFDFYNHVFTGDDADTYREYIDAYISARAAAGHRMRARDMVRFSPPLAAKLRPAPRPLPRAPRSSRCRCAGCRPRRHP